MLLYGSLIEVINMAPKLKCVGMKIDDGIDEKTIRQIVGNMEVGIYAERRGSNEFMRGYVGIKPAE